MILSTSDNKKYQVQVVIHLSVAVPLVCGAFPYAILALRGTRIPNEKAMRFWNSAIATFTVGSVFRGVLDLYGSTNKLSVVYPIAGAVLVVLTIVSLIRGRKRD